MSKIIQYWVETNKTDRDCVGVYDDGEYQDARRHAERIKGIVVEAEYEFSDTNLVDDFTGGDDA